VKGKPDLLELVGALHSVRGFTYFLNGREQQTDHNRDDGDDDQ